jgi:cell division protein FtsA
MSRHTLAEVVEPRYQELFELVLKQLQDSGLEDQIAAGIVLTGGTSSISGAVDIAEATFGMPVRVASPLPVKGLYEYVDQPIYSTGIGLLHYGARRVIERQFERPERQGVTSFLNRVKSWFKGEF